MSTIALLGRLALSLAVVLALLAVAGRLLHRQALFAPGGTPSVRVSVLARTALGKNASVAVVSVAGKTLVVGVTAGSMQVLTEAEVDLTAPAPDPPAAASRLGRSLFPKAGAGAGRPPRPAPDLRSLVAALRERTVRRLPSPPLPADPALATPLLSPACRPRRLEPACRPRPPEPRPADPPR